MAQPRARTTERRGGFGLRQASAGAQQGAAVAMAAAMAGAAAATTKKAAAMTAAKRAAAVAAAAAAAARRRGRRGEGRAGLARAAPGVPLGAWLEPRPSGLRVRIGGLSRRSEPSDHLQAAVCLSIERELCAHSPTSAQSVQAKASQAPARARPQAMPERARGWAMAVGTEQPPSAWPGRALQKRQASGASAINSFCSRRPALIHRKLRFFYCWNRKAPSASSDAPFRPDHYGVLRSRVLQRVVAVLQVKV